MYGLSIHAINQDTWNPIAPGAMPNLRYGGLEADRDGLGVAVVFNTEDTWDAMDGCEVHGFVDLPLLGATITERDPGHRVLSQKATAPRNTYRMADVIGLRALKRDDAQPP